MEKVGAKVRFYNNSGELESIECEVCEVKSDHYRLKKPSGEIIRIFHNRVVNADNAEPQVEKSSAMVDNEEYNPFDGLDKKFEVWIKSNTFSNTTICRTYAIIDPKSDKYESVNTYNGKAPKIMSYNMKNYESLINRLQKKGYERAERP